MSRKSFYVVKSEAYLFGLQQKADQPEEEVRQWVLYELLRRYHVSINLIRIEHPLQIGTRFFRADITVGNDSGIYIVVECKRRDHKFTVKDANQLSSYADALNSQFAVWTNGNDWFVRRKINGQWQVVIDIPDFFDFSDLRTTDISNYYNLSHLLTSFDVLQVMLYWLYRDVPGEQAKIFLGFLDIFIDNWRFDYESKLVSALSKLCKVLAHSTFLESAFQDETYRHGTIRVVFNDIKDFLKQVGQHKEYPQEPLIWEMIGFIENDLRDVVLSSSGINATDLHFAHLVLALNNYLKLAIRARQYITIPTATADPFWRLLESNMLWMFSARLPDRSDSFGITLLQEQGRGAFEKLRRYQW